MVNGGSRVCLKEEGGRTIFQKNITYRYFILHINKKTYFSVKVSIINYDARTMRGNPLPKYATDYGSSFEANVTKIILLHKYVSTHFNLN